jgi:WD40 repeat protein
LRAHIGDILSLDIQKDKIITASRDHTIRLWDLRTFDQDYEFTTPVDLPLCVAAHPTLPLFSCGFESGVLRVFDIEKTCVSDEFVQFNKPLSKLAYSPRADLLVTCCVDGSIAIHNALRQHLPTKMIHLEFPPENVHVAFTRGDLSTDQSHMFAIMGEHGNSVKVLEQDTFVSKH